MPAKLKPPPIQLFKKLGGQSFELEQIQRNVDVATRAARANPENRSRVIENLSCPGSGDFVVFHGLGRRPIGYQLVRKRSGAPEFDERSRTSKHLVFSASSSGVLDLKVW